MVFSYSVPLPVCCMSMLKSSCMCLRPYQHILTTTDKRLFHWQAYIVIRNVEEVCLLIYIVINVFMLLMLVLSKQDVITMLLLPNHMKQGVSRSIWCLFWIFEGGAIFVVWKATRKCNIQLKLKSFGIEIDNYLPWRRPLATNSDCDLWAVHNSKPVLHISCRKIKWCPVHLVTIKPHLFIDSEGRGNWAVPILTAECRSSRNRRNLLQTLAR